VKHNIDNDKIVIIINTGYIKRVNKLTKGIELERKRIKLTEDFVFPPIRIVDDEDLPINGYQIKMKGELKKYGERSYFRISGLLKDLRKIIIENKDQLKESS